MKVIQTIYCNTSDFQSRVITLDIDWDNFKTKVLNAINNGDYIKDEDMKLKSESLLLGTLIPKTYKSMIIKDDEFHLMIKAEIFNGIEEIFMFYLIGK